MKKIWICLILIGCTGRPAYVIQPYSAPKVIVRSIEKEVGNLNDLESLEENELEGNMLYPDPTRGFIENRAYPFVPKVWVVTKGKMVILVGPEEGPPEFLNGEIREFKFDPGLYVLHIERWRLMPNGWEKMKRTEVIKLSVAQTEQQLGSVDYYSWRIIINKTGVNVCY